MKSLKKKLFTLGLTIFLCLPIAFPRATLAQTRAWGEISTNCIYEDASGDQIATIEGIECVVTNLLNIGVSLVGIASFIMLLVGGVLYLTSGGNPKNTETGSKTISYAIRGILVSISGWIVINFIATFTGVEEVKIFRITIPSPGP